jgi:hypothetical protein
MRMRSRWTAVAAVVLAATTLPFGVQAGGGGCAINVTYVNKESTQSKVDQEESEVKSKQLGLWGSWASIGWADGQLGVIKVPANGRKVKTYQLGFPCSYPRRYRFTVMNGGNRKTVYKPSSTGQTTKVNLTVNINF